VVAALVLIVVMAVSTSGRAGALPYPHLHDRQLTTTLAADQDQPGTLPGTTTTLDGGNTQ